jgi:hypothetical protein
VIVRILEEGQYELDDANAATLEELDGVLSEALQSADEDTFAAALDAILAEVRTSGRKLPESSLLPSDVALPRPGATLEEVRALLESPVAGAEDGQGSGAASEPVN